MSHPVHQAPASQPFDIITEDRALTVVRTHHLPDPLALAHALAAGGIRAIELTFTTPDVLRHLAAATAAGYLVGVGTVLTTRQATDAIDAGAGFLVTPALRPEVTALAVDAGIPIMVGALTPTEVLAAVESGATAVKVFPATVFGPGYLRDLRGPYPHIPLIPSGGINATNARAYLDAGALAVTAGSDVVPSDLVANGRWAEITDRAMTFVRACRTEP